MVSHSSKEVCLKMASAESWSLLRLVSGLLAAPPSIVCIETRQNVVGLMLGCVNHVYYVMMMDLKPNYSNS